MINWPLDEIRKHIGMAETYSIISIDLDNLIRYCQKFEPDEIHGILENINEFFRNYLPYNSHIWKSDGDEYLICIPYTSKYELEPIITDVKKKFRRQKFAANCKREYANVSMTFSAGISMYAEDGESLYGVIKKANVALFLAKAYWRDKVFLYPRQEKGNSSRILFDLNARVDVVLGQYGEYGFLDSKAEKSSVRLWEPQAIDIDDEGCIYIVDQDTHSILMYDGERYVTRIIGNGKFGYTGDGGKAVQASLNKPTGLSFYKNKLYISDTQNNVVRLYDMRSGIITTVAGTGEAGYEGDGGLATRAKLNKPSGATVDEYGNLYIIDFGNFVIRKLDQNGGITTYAGTGEHGYNGDGKPALDTSFSEIYGIDIDRKTGDIYLADYSNHRIRRIDGITGIVQTVAGTGIAGYSGDGGLPWEASINRPEAVHVDGAGNIFIAECSNSCVRMIPSDRNLIYTLIGDGTAGSSVEEDIMGFRLSNPCGLKTDKKGRLYIVDGANSRICRLTLNRGGYVNE